MKDWLRRRLPTPEAVQSHRWLRWIGPRLLHPRLWHLGRRGIALGVALGLFFGLLVPVAQIPLSAGAAVLLRANLPCAIASTLVTNPVTFGPVYYAAWKVGGAVLGSAEPVRPRPTPAPEAGWWQRLAGVGKPLVVGLGLFAVAAGLLSYALISGLWRLRTAWRWRQRRAVGLRPRP